MPSILHAPQTCPRRSQSIHYINRPPAPKSNDFKALGAYSASENEPLARVGVKIFPPNPLEKKAKGPAQYLSTWVGRLPPGCERKEAWVDVDKQIGLFFRGPSFFFSFHPWTLSQSVCSSELVWDVQMVSQWRHQWASPSYSSPRRRSMDKEKKMSIKAAAFIWKLSSQRRLARMQFLTRADAISTGLWNFLLQLPAVQIRLTSPLPSP